MVAHAEQPLATREAYLEREELAQTKSEYYGGVIIAMAGASPEHDRIAGDTYAIINSQLRGRLCEPFTSDMRIYVPACNRFYYPDVSVACGGSQFESIAGVRSLVNPVLVVEVLSKSTEAMDRGEKLICYQTIPSLQTYLIVAQVRPQIQVYERQSDGSWSYRLFQELESTIALPSVGCDLALADVYARIEFLPSGEAAPS